MVAFLCSDLQWSHIQPAGQFAHAEMLPVRRFFWDSFCRRFPNENRKNFDQLLTWLNDGLLSPEIDNIYPLEQFQLALQELGTGDCTGRLLLAVKN